MRLHRFGVTVLVVLALISVGIRCGKREAVPQLTAEEIEQHRAKIRAVTAQTQASTPAMSVPTPPTVPRLVSTKVELPPKVYLDPGQMLAHNKKCSSVTRRMVRTPVAAARMQGYQPHESCVNLPVEPEFRVQVTTHPEWIDYERRLANFKLAQANTQVTEPPSVNQPTYSSPSSPSAQSLSTPSARAVHVKGHTRKDGTYVPPHTRSKPRK